MKLKCRILGKDYDIISGASFSEEYNETLDSGAILIDHVPYIKGLKPYDDVYIWDSDEEFHGYHNKGEKAWVSDVGASMSSSYETETGYPFSQRNSVISLAIEDSGLKICGSIVDIWSYMLLDSPYGAKRYSLGKISMKISMLSEGLDDISAYYSLPESVSDIDSENSTMILRLNDSFSSMNDSGAPSTLTVGFRRDVPDFGSYTIEGYKLGGVLISKEASHTVGQITYPYIIYNITPLIQTQNAYSESAQAKTNGTLRVSGLKKEELLSLEKGSVSISGKIKGRSFSMPLEEAREDGEKVILVFSSYFQEYQGLPPEPFSFKVGISVEMEAEEGSEDSWSGVFATNLRYLYGTTLGPNVYDVEDGYQPGVFLYYLDEIENSYGKAEFTFQSQTELPSFFKHMLVDRMDIEMVDLDRENYKYKISLMSETKRLEKVVLPNISITQPIAIGVKKRSIMQYMQQLLDLYSPKVKRSVGNGEWAYVSKYILDARDPDDISGDKTIEVPLSAIFKEDVYAPEMSLSAPTLREALSRLMIVMDCIPVVKNDVIYAMRISDTHGEYVVDGNHTNFLMGTMDSGNFSTALRREYQGGISQRNSAHSVEYIGFRNGGSALLTLENMTLETRFPIYKINKLLLCYYKKVTVAKKSSPEDTYDKVVLIKQDISSLVLQNTVRNALPADWTKYPSEIDDFDDMRKYRLLTIGYDIGSKTISGWGEKYSYLKDPLGWLTETQTYMETMLNMLDGGRISELTTKNGFFPLGIERMQFLDPDEQIIAVLPWTESAITPNLPQGFDPADDVNLTLKMKSMFFKIDYNAMYSGTVIVTKDGMEEDDLATTDNSASSLAILEVDGMYQKEKANRFANQTRSWPARYDDYHQMNDDYNNVLGSVRYDEDEENDIIVYHREYQIFDDCVLSNFVGMHEYVLKNYYTNVFAKYRTYSYASYTESIERKENDRYSIMLSDGYQVYEEGMISGLSIGSILSAFSPSEISERLTLEYPNSINGGYMEFADGSQYFTDVNSFVSGYSICFNARMPDPLTAGLYVSEFTCFDDGTSIFSHDNNFVGSAQQWYKMPVNSDADGFLEKVGFYFGHFSNEADIPSSFDPSEEGYPDKAFDSLFALPKKGESVSSSVLFGKTYDFCKDNKEVIDYTLQYEIMNENRGKIAFTEWMTKLSEYGNYAKLPKDAEIIDISSEGIEMKAYFSTKTVYKATGDFLSYSQLALMRIPNSESIEDLIDKPISSAIAVYRGQFGRRATYVLNYIKSASSSDDITVSVTRSIVRRGSDSNDVQDVETIDAVFRKMPESGETGHDDYFCSFDNNLPDGSLTPYWEYTNYKTWPTEREDWNLNLSVSNSDIVISLIVTDGDKFVYPKNMFLIVSDSKIDKSLICRQLDPDDLPEGMTVIDSVKVPDVFSFTEDELGRPVIRFSPTPELGAGYESVQYWYLDKNVSGHGSETASGVYENTYEGDGLLHFVFGIDAEPDDGGKDIYVSCVKSRRREVYGSEHEVVGYVANTAEDGYAPSYAEGKQAYDPIDDEEEE